MLHALNLYSGICQLYFNKAGRKRKRLAISVSPHGRPWFLTSESLTSDYHKLISYQVPTNASHCARCLCQKCDSDEGDKSELRSQARQVSGDTCQKEIQDDSCKMSLLCNSSCNSTAHLEQGEIKRTFQTKQFLICFLWRAGLTREIRQQVCILGNCS